MNIDSITGRPDTARGQAHQYGLSSISNALPIHERLKPKYPRLKNKPVSAADVGVLDLCSDIYKQLKPTNSAG